MSPLMSRTLSWLRFEWGWLVISILVVHFILGAVYSLVNPIWEGPDESAHYDYIKYLADNLSLPKPTDSKSPMDALTQPPLYYIVTALAISWVDTGDDLQPVENPYTYTGITEGGVNSFIHSDVETIPYQGTVLANHVARLVSVFISTLVVAVTYLLGRLLFPEPQVIALGAMAINAFSPAFLFMGSVINNDVLVTLFFSLALFFSVKVVIRIPNLRDLLALGGFTGLAFLSKYNALALIPLVVISLGLAMERLLRSRRSLAMSFFWGGLVLLGVALVYGWWFLRSLVVFGSPTARAGRLIARLFSDPLGVTRRLHWDVLPDGLKYFYTSFWASFGWGNIVAEAWVYQILGLLCLAGISGLMLFMLGKAAHSVKAGTLMLLLSFLFLLALATYRALAAGDPVLRGRYVLPSISAVSVLLSLGIVSLTPRRIGYMPILLAGLIIFVLGLIAPFRYILPAYALPPILSPEEAMDIPNSLTINFGDKIELLGYELGIHKARAGEPISITLYWRCLADMEENYTVGLSILGPDLQAYGQLAAYPGHGNYATSVWKEGDIIKDSFEVRVHRTFPAPGMARIYVALYTYPEEEHLALLDAHGEPTGDAAIFGRISVAPAQSPEYAIEHPLYYNLGDRMALVGYEIEEGMLGAGCLHLTLYWQALADMEEDYTVFVHVVDEEEETLMQDDGHPRNGYYPTSFWHKGEIIEDEYYLCLPRNMGSGTYDILVGVYLLQTMQRLPTFDAEGDRVLHDQILLRELEIVSSGNHSFLPFVLR